MRIRRILVTTSLVSTGLLVALVAFFALAARSNLAANTELDMIHELHILVFERQIMLDEFFLHREPRAEAQVLEKTAMLSTRLAEASARMRSRADRAEIERMVEVSNQALEILQHLISGLGDEKIGKLGASGAPVAPGAMPSEIEKRMMSQLLIKSYRLNGQTVILEEQKLARLEVNRQLTNSALIAAFAVVLVFMIANSITVTGYVSRGIRQLLEGAKEIGKGNFRHRLRLEGKNELSEVGSEVNRMAEALEKSFTSIGNLEFEAKLRTKAEDEIRKLNLSLEERVAQRTAELADANKELEAFAYSISHDLKAPLRSIEGFSRIVVEDYGKILDEEGRRLLSIIMDSAIRLETLISDILTLSRVGRTTLEPSMIDMRAMALAAYEETTDEAQRAAISLDIGPLHDAWGDPVLMRQVWTNLLSNAVKFTGKSGRREIGVVSEEGEREIIYTVSDSGAGFNMAYSDKLFQIFQRLHSVSEFDGTGVGLATIKRIVDRHGGQVGATGKVGIGASFWFTLPRRG